MNRIPGLSLRKEWLRNCARGLALASLGAGVLFAASVSAQEEPDAAETAAARALAVDGVKLADAGRCDEALDKLARAEKLHHAPVVLGRLGECQILLGKLVDGTENLRKVLREPLPAEPLPVLLKARERAQGVLDRAKVRIAALNVTVKGPLDQGALSVTVDGQPMNLALLEADRPTDPGEHLVEASAPGFSRGSTRVVLAAGDRQSIVIQLEPDPNAPASGAVVNHAPVAQQPSNTALPAASLPASGAVAFSDSTSNAPREEPNLTPAYIAWAAGGAAIAVGSIFGLIALDGKNDLDGQCPGNVCPETARDRLESARGASTAATVLLVAGGASIGLGTVLYFLAGSSEEDSEQSQPLTLSGDPLTLSGNRAPRAPQAWIGLGQVGLSGEF